MHLFFKKQRFFLSKYLHLCWKKGGRNRVFRAIKIAKIFRTPPPPPWGAYSAPRPPATFTRYAHYGRSARLHSLRECYSLRSSVTRFARKSRRTTLFSRPPCLHRGHLHTEDTCTPSALAFRGHLHTEGTCTLWALRYMGT